MTYALTWLPGVLLEANLKVAEVDGWQQRGHGNVSQIAGVMCHHTAGPLSGNMPSLKTLIDGRHDLPGPLAQLGLGRDGAYYVVAAGLCYHAGPGRWKGIETGNHSFIGIEAENAGTADDPWPPKQLDAYRRGVAAILRYLGKGVDDCVGHREYALPKGRKSDPSFDMTVFRSSVLEVLNGTAAPLQLIPAFAPPAPGSDEPRPTLRRYSTGKFVRELQQLLGLDVDGFYGPLTEAAVRARQKVLDLHPDGIVGPITWAALTARAAQAL